MTSLARLHRARIDAKAAGDSKTLARLENLSKARKAAAGATPAPRQSLAQQHRDRALGVQAASAAANDNAGAEDLARDASPATIQRLAMAEDRRQLKAVKSVEKKIELKRELLPKYSAWVAGVLDGGETARDLDPAFRAAQDDVVLNVLIWRLDVGDLHGAFVIFDFALTHGWVMPAQFKRDLVTFVTEQAADGALQALEAGGEADLVCLDMIESRVRDLDMPDEVRARLHKAMGRELARRAAAPDNSAAGQRRARLEAALAHLNRARALDDQSGCKGDILKIERELKKTDAEEPPPPPPPETQGSADA